MSDHYKTLKVKVLEPLQITNISGRPVPVEKSSKTNDEIQGAAFCGFSFSQMQRKKISVEH